MGTGLRYHKIVLSATVESWARGGIGKTPTTLDFWDTLGYTWNQTEQILNLPNHYYYYYYDYPQILYVRLGTSLDLAAPSPGELLEGLGVVVLLTCCLSVQKAESARVGNSDF